ncbi:MAG: hypothetical protein JXR56_02475 [Candidatus Cloacimonetes bacterium]|nr:hypothetical protein [Candidatus Cloacimonadota bacterium]
MKSQDVISNVVEIAMDDKGTGVFGFVILHRDGTFNNILRKYIKNERECTLKEIKSLREKLLSQHSDKTKPLESTNKKRS